MVKYVDFQNCIHVSGYKNINFDEVVVFSEMYTWFKLYKYLFAWSTLISRNVYLFHGIKLLIFEEVRWYQQIYTCFTLWKYQFWWSRCFSRNVYLIQVIQISILMKYGDFQKCIHDSGYKNINFYDYVEFLKWIPVSRDKNINFEEVRWFPEMYTCFRL